MADAPPFRTNCTNHFPPNPNSRYAPPPPNPNSRYVHPFHSPHHLYHQQNHHHSFIPNELNTNFVINNPREGMYPSPGNFHESLTPMLPPGFRTNGDRLLEEFHKRENFVRVHENMPQFRVRSEVCDFETKECNIDAGFSAFNTILEMNSRVPGSPATGDCYFLPRVGFQGMNSRVPDSPVVADRFPWLREVDCRVHDAGEVVRYGYSATAKADSCGIKRFVENREFPRDRISSQVSSPSKVPHKKSSSLAGRLGNSSHSDSPINLVLNKDVDRRSQLGANRISPSKRLSYGDAKKGGGSASSLFVGESPKPRMRNSKVEVKEDSEKLDVDVKFKSNPLIVSTKKKQFIKKVDSSPSASSLVSIPRKLESAIMRSGRTEDVSNGNREKKNMDLSALNSENSELLRNNGERLNSKAKMKSEGSSSDVKKKRLKKTAGPSAIADDSDTHGTCSSQIGKTSFDTAVIQNSDCHGTSTSNLIKKNIDPSVTAKQGSGDAASYSGLVKKIRKRRISKPFTINLSSGVPFAMVIDGKENTEQQETMNSDRLGPSSSPLNLAVSEQLSVPSLKSVTVSSRKLKKIMKKQVSVPRDSPLHVGSGSHRRSSSTSPLLDTPTFDDTFSVPSTSPSKKIGDDCMGEGIAGPDFHGHLKEQAVESYENPQFNVQELVAAHPDCGMEERKKDLVLGIADRFGFHNSQSDYVGSVQVDVVDNIGIISHQKPIFEDMVADISPISANQHDCNKVDAAAEGNSVMPDDSKFTSNEGGRSSVSDDLGKVANEVIRVQLETSSQKQLVASTHQPMTMKRPLDDILTNLCEVVLQKKQKTENGVSTDASSLPVPPQNNVVIGHAGLEKNIIEGKTVSDLVSPFPSQSAATGSQPKPPVLKTTASSSVKANSFTPHPFYQPQSSNKFVNKKGSSPIIGPRTWRRDSSSTTLAAQSSVSHQMTLTKPLTKKPDNIPNSAYVRRGNSLVRKPAPSFTPTSASPLIRSATNQSYSQGILPSISIMSGREDGKSSEPVNQVYTEKIVANDDSGKIAPIEMLKTPPLASSPGTSPLASTTDLFSDVKATPWDEALGSKLARDKESINGKASPQANESNLENNQEILEENGNGMPIHHSDQKQLTYAKPKSNQLVAAAKLVSHSLHANIVENPSASSALGGDVYYKRNKNQIVRDIALSDGQTVSTKTIGETSTSEELKSMQLASQKSNTNGKSDQDRRRHKHPKNSRVWTLKGNQSSNDYGILRRIKLLPTFLPWKKGTYEQHFSTNMSSFMRKMPHPLISRKLQYSRKMDMLYTRSRNGFSLHKSGVRSVGGSNLKWSKSIEKRSKKACEEATLAVLAVVREMKKRAACGAKKRLSHKDVSGTELQPGERVISVGSMQYKMDSSKRTLQLLSAESYACSEEMKHGTSANPIVPRRLTIGNNEYVRIGNGNQLVRNPKKMVRILANERVKWSLHTIRSRIVKKHQYCQFFTRFGVCNKEDGKCPYIHDPEKIAVCTKFLKGGCSNANCKLTHKVIPERMPDCSFFLQGMCSGEKCAYRHVNVNPNAPICNGFLKGYCAEGDKCCKKHSYTCPRYEATGACSQRARCKLHHPKKKDSRGGAHTQQKDQKKMVDRYFVSSFLDTTNGSGELILRNLSLEDSMESIFSDGKFTDYISLETGVETVGDGDCWNIEGSSRDLDVENPKLNLDSLIKPVRLMKNQTKGSSPIS